MSSIPLGIGDLFIIRLINDQYEINNTVILNKYILDTFRSSDINLLEFTKELMKKLFEDVQIIDRKEKINYKHLTYTIKPINISIKHYFDLQPIYNFPYIVIHTKARFDIKNVFIKPWYNRLQTYLKSYICKYKIIILGEKLIQDDTLETKQHAIKSIYPDLQCLIAQNDVLDLTTNDKLYIQPNYNRFIHELQIISNAKMNFGIGWGGNFGMSWAVGDMYCFYIDTLINRLTKAIIQMNDPNKILCGTIDPFIKVMDNFKI